MGEARRSGDRLAGRLLCGEIPFKTPYLETDAEVGKYLFTSCEIEVLTARRERRGTTLCGQTSPRAARAAQCLKINI